MKVLKAINWLLVALQAVLLVSGIVASCNLFTIAQTRKPTALAVGMNCHPPLGITSNSQ